MGVKVKGGWRAKNKRVRCGQFCRVNSCWESRI